MGKQVKVKGLFAPHGSQWTVEPTAFRTSFTERQRVDNIMEDKKQKYAYWLKPSLVMEMESMLDDANATSKSDFITQAIKFYIGYLRQKKCVDFISPILAQSIKSEIGSVEQNISKMLFKLSVEQSIVNNLIASQNEIDEGTMEDSEIYVAKKLHGLAVL